MSRARTLEERAADWLVATVLTQGLVARIDERARRRGFSRAAYVRRIIEMWEEAGMPSIDAFDQKEAA